MKIAWTLGITAAVLFHGAVIAFGGIFFLHDDKDQSSLRTVDLLSDEDIAEKKKPDEQEKKPEEEQDQLETEEEAPPDAEEIIRSLDSPLDSAPALDQASLGAIEAALNGLGGGGDFADALTFAQGSQFGAHGKVGADVGTDMDQVLDMSDVDQPPRAIVQESPVVPSEMRGKKVEGVVAIKFVVDANGKVSNPRVEKSTHVAFEKPALEAIRKWKFEAGVRAGKSVPTKMRVQIRFPPS